MGKLQIDVLLQRARRAFAAGELDEARDLLEQLLLRDGNHARAVAMLGQIAFAQNRFEKAASYMLRAAALRPKEPLTHIFLGEIRTFQGRFDEAAAEYDKVLRWHPQDQRAIAGKADACERSGQRDKARALLQPIVERGRETAQQAIIQARLDLHDRNYDAVIGLVNRHLERGDAEDHIVRGLCQHLGQALERTNRFDKAFAAYKRSNRAVPAPFDLESWVQETDDSIKSFSPQRLAALPRASHGSQLPVFVLGMPRSGSTLVETILDAHPDVAAAGELTAIQESINSISLDIGSTLPYPACIDDLDQNDVDTMAGTYLDRLRRTDDQAQRIVDKYLNNYLHIGMLAILFPRALIIHCRRHPLDTCLSCFVTTLLPAAHPYASDLGHVGAVYVAYERLMAHWRDALEIPMLDMPYEALVADPEGMTRRLLDFCGLAWDDRCLRFYEGDRVVLTASYDQVNRPIYSSSVGRYRNFEKHLGPLKEALAEGGWTEEAFERAATAGQPNPTI
ncbi:MAG: tetratricopeptide repeat-containing sulfotransferase family protein [Planctomycetota bacterium]|jgi:tetratricopeptide (TPR) repeat protein